MLRDCMGAVWGDFQLADMNQEHNSAIKIDIATKYDSILRWQRKIFFFCIKLTFELIISGLSKEKRSRTI